MGFVFSFERQGGTELSRARSDSRIPTRKNYEIGRLPRLQVLARLAGALEVMIDWILAAGCLVL
jgi:hypothetical protein